MTLKAIFFKNFIKGTQLLNDVNDKPELHEFTGRKNPNRI